ncbi:MAG: glutamate racemase [Oligoflexia bacterium]|nr:glutamate racemase [Oligoflexia bacterium]
MKKLRLGFFDSGLGGLTVAREVRRLCPWADMVYLGDTARVPYGTRSDEMIRRYAGEGAAFLRRAGVDALVVACNTMSALALPGMCEAAGVPVFGVIEPGAREVGRIPSDAPVGVLATPATVDSGAYERAVRQLAPGREVFCRAAPLLVPLVEEGWVDGEVPRLVLERYLEPLLGQGVGVIVLGCTHYPLLKTVIREVLEARGRDDIQLVDSGVALARELRAWVDERFPELGQTAAELGRDAGALSVFVTDSPRRFKLLAERFLGEPVETIESVSLV